jgi:hypothetical protein
MKGQYQHFIPQFLLRNFSHPYEPTEKTKPKNTGRYCKRKDRRRGDKVLNVADLTPDEPQLLEPAVSRWYGQKEMYEDIADAIESRKDVERELSNLEYRTVEILQKVKRVQEGDQAGIWLTRVERNRLCKFLFIMKYRGPGYCEKYFVGHPSEYESEEKHLVRAYMVKQGPSSPRDVWLHNLHTLLDLNMDADGVWMTEIRRNMFPADANMFVLHSQSSYMAFCTPAEKNDEFLLTDDCYNVFEGPTHESFCSQTGKFLGPNCLPYHEFGPVSPRLIIVLRSFILPEAQEDTAPSVRNYRATLRKAAASQFPDPGAASSILADLPVSKATNSYTTVMHDRLQLVPGNSGAPRLDDKFLFRFWPIETKHVERINFIFLDNLPHSESVVFNSQSSFKNTLEAYLTTPLNGFKSVGIGEYGSRTSRMDCLKKLSTILSKMGSGNVTLTFNSVGLGGKPCVQSLDETWLDMTRVLLGSEDQYLSGLTSGVFWEVYSLLGTILRHDGS